VNPLGVAALSIGTWAAVLTPVFLRYRFRRRCQAVRPAGPDAPAVTRRIPPQLPGAFTHPGEAAAQPFDSAIYFGTGEGQ
jgi:hypothetical protein